MIRIGNGYDVHKLVEGRKLVLGGVEIPHTKGVLGTSGREMSYSCCYGCSFRSFVSWRYRKTFP